MKNGIILYLNRDTHRVTYSKCTIDSCGDGLRLVEVRTPTLRTEVTDNGVVYLCDTDFGQWFDGQHAKFMVFPAEEVKA